jgi:rhamnosyltransferase
MNSKIYALVTLYYPKIHYKQLIYDLSSQVSIVFLLDNSDGIDNSSMFCGENIKYINNKSNIGLAAAFNKCMKNIKFKKSDYLIFMDQDSIIKENHIKLLLADYEQISKKGIKIGCIGPIVKDKDTGEVLNNKIKKNIFNNIYTIDCLQASSMLIEYKNLEKIGFWNNDIFLDLGDWDLCWRLQAIGLLCFITKNVVLDHKLGESKKELCVLSIREGLPIREYYQTRDCLKLLPKKYTPLKYKVKFILVITIRPILHIFFLSEKKLRMKYIFLGFLDFFRSINGSFDLRMKENTNSI